MKRGFAAWAAVVVLVLACTGPAAAQDTLAVWWEKGLHQGEDDALTALIRRFEAKYRIKVELSWHGGQEMVPRLLAALDAGRPPDIGFGNRLDLQANAQWAYDDRLENISDLIDPIRARFDPLALSTVFLYDKALGTRAFYAFPIRQHTLLIHYWKDMLAEAGYGERDIPTQWDAYWDFWCRQVQESYRSKTGNRAYGVGLSMGVESSDAIHVFAAFMDAYKVRLVDALGKLQLDDPSVRTGLAQALASYTALFATGCTPPSSSRWQDPDNDVAFINRTTLLTPEAGLSIVARQRQDMANPALSAERRAAPATHTDAQIVTSGLPNRPDGSKMVYRTSVKAGVIFKGGRNTPGARKFVRFLLEDSNLGAYVEASRGAWFPVMQAARQRALRQMDAATAAGYQHFMNGAVPHAFATNPRFALLNRENVWAKAMHRVIDDGVAVEQAVDDLLARIRAVAGP